MDNFIDENYINSLLNEKFSETETQAVLEKAAKFEGLTPKEVAALLTTDNPAHLTQIFEIAAKIKQHIYGDRIVLFAPLYISDYCVNNCLYCGFNCCKTEQTRHKLTQTQVKQEVEMLVKMGHKRIALEAGEDSQNCPLDYVLDCIDTIYKMKFDNGEIRRVNVNIAALDVADFVKLKNANIGTYLLFQETYHKPTYEKFHKGGPKKDYIYHLNTFDRAMEAQIEDVGAGALFGLFDYRFEVLALMLHNEHLESRFNVGFHTISVPRIRAEEGTSPYPYAVTDDDFLRLTAILRIAVPFTGLIVSTRETAEMRKQLINIGISQISAGSSTAVGGYSGIDNFEQFSTADHRAARDIIYWLMEEKTLPSFCTACYRQGRSGDRFMELAKTGEIKNVCLPNGLLTLKEYAIDYGDEKFNTLADSLIAEKINDISNETVRNSIAEKLKQLENGKRDIFI
ncbi:MAG: [FeFe] hydrogenase H-cluster radical SAM maturase HydG [Firmicutes bacterium]|nr:[FeFe] hydrogenase H-cluster radical SAM maturase HydG [Bacillota bacterium]